MKLVNIFLLSHALPTLLVAQHRYFDPIFPEVKVTADVIYGVNATVLLINPPPNGAGQAIPQNLKMDVYEPANDTASARPLIILLHSGNFLPQQVNGGCNGTKLDGEIVALAQRLAQRGFVVAAADYRLGWNPVLTDIEIKFTLVNALNRGVQDSRTCIRFFKKDHAENDQFRIDPNKITLWGSGTGGWITLASATLDDMNDWYLPKFSSPAGPFVYEPVNGNLDGTSVGVVPPNYPPFPVGDTLCYPNHVGYDSDFALAVNMAGVLLDTSWLQSDDIPVISFASPSYSGLGYAREACGMGNFGYDIPPFGMVTIIPDVAGSCAIQARQSMLGNNIAWQNAGFSDPLTLHAQTINEGHEGFYPFKETYEYTPWAFASSISPYGVPTAMCDTGFMSASAYLDTVLAYFAPRACAVLGLNANCNMAVATKEPFLRDNLLIVSPNPAVNEIRVIAEKPILSAELYDLHGRIIWKKSGLNAFELRIPRANSPSGVYCLKAQFAEGLCLKKVIWE